MGNELTVTRTDSKVGWAQELQLEVTSYMGFIFKEMFKTVLSDYRAGDGAADGSWHDLVNEVTQEVYTLLHDLLQMNLLVKDIDPVLGKLKTADVNAEVSFIQRAPVLIDVAGRNNELVAAIKEALETLQFKELVADFVRACDSSDAVQKDDADYVFVKGLGQSGGVKLNEVAETFKQLRDLFQGIGGEAGHLFAAVCEVDNLVEFFRDHDFHSPAGEREFQDIVQRITTTCSHDQFLSALVDAVLIDCQPQLAPFIPKDRPCRDVLADVRRLQENQRRQAINSVQGIRHANENIAEVRLLFDAQTDTTFVNVQARVDALIERGSLEISLCRLEGKSSAWALTYPPAGTAGREVKMDGNDIEDFQRQLGFCSKLTGDADRKAARFGKVMQLIQRYVQRWFTLEAAGHNDYQLKKYTEKLHSPDEQYERYLEMEIENLNNKLSDFQGELQRARSEFPFLLLLENYDIVLLLNLLNSDVTNDIKMKTVELLMTEVDWKQQPGDRAMQLEHLIDRSLIIFIELVSGFSDILGSQADCIGSGRLAFNDNQGAPTKFHRLGSFFGCVYATLQPSPRGPPQQCIYSIPSKQHGGTNHIIKLILARNLDRSGTVPRDAQTLWCSQSTSVAELDFFFERITYFVSMSFTLVGIDRLRPNSRDRVVQWQDKLAQAGEHGDVIYIFQDHAAEKTRKFLEEPGSSLERAIEELEPTDVVEVVCDARQHKQHITVVCGGSASGKTHWLCSQLNDREHIAISINDHVDVHRIISRLSSVSQDDDVAISFNISAHAVFEDVNRFLYQLFICGVVRDYEKGAIFALASNNKWQFYVEVPHSEEWTDEGMVPLRLAGGTFL